MYLVDTNVISARAPSRVPPAEMAAWMDANSARRFLSGVTITEIEDGLAKAKREGATRKSRDLDAWLETVLHLYAARILPFDLEAARLAGAFSKVAPMTFQNRTACLPISRRQKPSGHSMLPTAA
jgi:predicted nucleic acid-binding protein